MTLEKQTTAQSGKEENMKIVDIIAIWGEEGNKSYSDELPSNNNGNYSQPCGGVVLNVGGTDIVVEIDDLSCGDFGDRIFIAVNDGIHLWRMNVGTMDDACIDSDEYIADTEQSISGCLGIGAREMISLAMDAIYFAAELDYLSWVF